MHIELLPYLINIKLYSSDYIIGQSGINISKHSNHMWNERFVFNEFLDIQIIYVCLTLIVNSQEPTACHT